MTIPFKELLVSAVIGLGVIPCVPAPALPLGCCPAQEEDGEDAGRDEEDEGDGGTAAPDAPHDVDVDILLKEHGGDPNAKDKDGQLIIKQAIQARDFKAVERLVGEGADVNALDAKGKSPVDYAIEAQSHQILKFLFEKNAKHFKRDSVSKALFMKDPRILGLLLEQGADPNTVGDKGASLLALALERGASADHVRYLIKHGADVRARDKEGKTPLHYAMKFEKYKPKRLECIGILLENGANVNAKDKQGNSPLHSRLREIQESSPACVEYLLKHGANPNARDSNGITPLHLAAYYGQDRIVKALLKRGAYLEAKDNHGATALHAATKRGRRCVELLIEKGIDVNVRDNAGWTPLHTAVNHLNKQAVIGLLRHRAKRWIKTKKGKTAEQLLSAKKTTPEDEYAREELIRFFENLDCFGSGALGEDDDGPSGSGKKSRKKNRRDDGF